jgi:hypothetical protein
VAKPPSELLELLKPFDAGIQELTLALRQVLLEELAPCHEYIVEVYVIAIHYGSSPKMKDGICYIAVMNGHINLGFLRGSELSNRHRLLEGTGKRMRHIKIRSLADVLQPAIRDYIEEARDLAGHEVPAGKPKTVTTSVKRKSKPKRTIGTSKI